MNKGTCSLAIPKSLGTKVLRVTTCEKDEHTVAESPGTLIKNSTVWAKPLSGFSLVTRISPWEATLRNILLSCITNRTERSSQDCSICVAPSPLCESNSQVQSVAWLSHLLSSNHCVDQVYIHNHSRRQSTMLAGLFLYSDQAQGKVAAAFVMFYLMQMSITSAASVISISFFTQFLWLTEHFHVNISLKVSYISKTLTICPCKASWTINMLFAYFLTFTIDFSLFFS